MSSGGIKFQLIHRHDLQRKWRNGTKPMTQLEGLRQLLHSDTIRLRAISQKVRLKQGNINAIRRQVLENNAYNPACTNGSSSSRRTKDYNVSSELPMHSGADYGTGQYLVKFRVGSPAQKLVLIADTGSDLTWMNCKYRCHGGRCRRDSNNHRVFRADHSSSFRTVPCSSSICKMDLANLFSLARCPSPLDPCSYDYRYIYIVICILFSSFCISYLHMFFVGSEVKFAS